jgi:hypothetical protein
MDNSIYDIPVFKSLPERIEEKKLDKSDRIYNLSVDDIFKDEPFENSNIKYEPFENSNIKYEPFENSNMKYEPFENSNMKYEPFENNNMKYDPFENNNMKYDPFTYKNIYILLFSIILLIFLFFLF